MVRRKSRQTPQTDARVVWEGALEALGRAGRQLMDAGDGIAEMDSTRCLIDLTEAQVGFGMLAKANATPQWTVPLYEGVSDMIEGLQSHDVPLYQGGFAHCQAVLAEVFPDA